MTIPVEHEDIEKLKAWGMGLDALIEKCHFCNSETRYWHARTNNPVCPQCAKQHKASELPNRYRTTS